MNKKSVAAACLAVLIAACTYVGYQRDYGAGSGPGLIGPEAVYGPVYYDPGPKPITQDEAVAMVNNYLASLRNPNLGIGKPVNEGDSYQIPIVTLDGSLVDIFVVDKFSGWIKSVYNRPPFYKSIR
jgi:hypothetical protein